MGRGRKPNKDLTTEQSVNAIAAALWTERTKLDLLIKRSEPSEFVDRFVVIRQNLQLVLDMINDAVIEAAR